MARTMNQTLAWITALVLSLVLFVAGFGLFKIMVKDGSEGHGGGHGNEHASSGHGEEAHAVKDEHGDAGHGEEHGTAAKASHGEEGHEAAAPHEPASPSEHGESPAKKEGHGSEAEEGEISADQFKSNEHH